MKPLLIAILGAESTGKTSLARALAEEFHSPWVAEYLREFCEAHQRTPRIDEQALILETQIANERAAVALAEARNAPLVVCDTTPLLTAVYSDFVFGDTRLFERALAHHATYAHTLLLANDLDWVEDGIQRDGEHVREPILAAIISKLCAHDLPYSLIDGDGHQRTLNAMHVIDSLLPPTRRTSADSRTDWRTD